MEISRKNPLDDFELLQRIGSGTYGDVYKARMKRTNKLACLKVIKIEPGDEFSIIQQEVLVMKDCKHPNIVRYFSSYLRREKLWIAMEYCGGGSLQDIYNITGSLTESEIAYVCKETLTGLAYMHDKRKMHRDIKGSNIVLTDNGDVKLVDFGVSAQITATISKRKSFIGTPYWMAPEVAAVERKGGYDYKDVASLLDPPKEWLDSPSTSSTPPPTKKKASEQSVLSRQMLPDVASLVDPPKEWLDSPNTSPTPPYSKKKATEQSVLSRQMLPCDIWGVGITAIELAETQPPMFDLHPMRALSLMSRKHFEPPKLKDKQKWSANLHSFVKMALTKNPKRRPTAQKLLEHPLFGDVHSLTSQLMRGLIEKVQNTNPAPFRSVDDEEDNIELSFPDKKIPSKVTSKHKDRPTSAIDPIVEGVKSALPIKPSKVNNDMCNSHHRGENWSPQEQEDPSSKKSLSASVAEELERRGHTQEASKFGEVDKQPSQSQASAGGSENDRPPPLPPKQRNTVPIKLSKSGENTTGKEPNNSVRQPGKKPIPPPKPKPNGSAPTFNGENLHEIQEDQQPPVAPPRRKRSEFKPKVSDPPQPYQTNGIPITPKVMMGACFLKVFNDCPLIIYCSASWVHPETRDQILLFGCEEGIYSLNTAQIHEGVMDQIFQRRTTWLYVINNVMMSLSGKSNLYQHNLLAIIDKNPLRFHMPSRFGDKLQRIPDKLVPRKFALSHKVPDTKGCSKCCVVLNPNNSHKYLCGAVPNGVVLLQWYEPMNKFLQVKVFECTLPEEIKVFEMLVRPDADLPIVCVGVARGKHLSFDFINLNSTSSWFVEHPPEEKSLDVVAVSQLERDKVLVCFDRDVKVVYLNDRPKSCKRFATELHFDFKVDSLVVLQDSVLAFYKHGMQGRSFRTTEVTQEICDNSKLFSLLGSDKLIVLKSYPANDPTAPCNIYLLTGHADMV